MVGALVAEGVIFYSSYAYSVYLMYLENSPMIGSLRRRSISQAWIEEAHASRSLYSLQ